MHAQKGQHLHGQGLPALKAGHQVLPHDDPQPVAVIVPPQRLDLDVLAQHVEAHVPGGLNVPDHGLVRRRGVQAVGPVALVQQARLEAGLAVQGQHPAAPVLHNGEFPHTEVAFHPVAGGQRHLQIVQIRVLRAPGAEVLRRNGAHAQSLFIGPAAGDDLTAAQHRDPRSGGVIGPDGIAQGFFVIVRGQPQGVNVVFRHALQPYRLPDAALGGVPDAAPVPALLAEGVDPAVGIVGDGRGQAVLPGDQGAGDVQGEGQIAPLMAPHGVVVYQHPAALIHRAEVQQHPVPAEALRQGKGPLIPQGLAAFQPEITAGQQALRREGHQYLSAAAAGILVAVLHGVVPQAVEAEIAVPPQLGPGILRQRAGFVRMLPPGGVKRRHFTVSFRFSRAAGMASSTRAAAAARKISAVGTCFTVPRSS